MSFTQVNLSNDTYEFIKNIGKSRSKQDEDRIILKEIDQLKIRFGEQNRPIKRMRENIIEAIYCEMLGHDASPFHIHAVNLVQEKSLSGKRLGYLACTLFLSDDNELMLLLINSIQKDLNSTNRLEVSSALSCISTLINHEVIPAVFPTIKNLLNHSSAQIRKRTCIVINSIFLSNPELILDELYLIRKSLCDPDPSVMGASLHVIYEMAKINPFGLKDLTPSLCIILKQVYGNKLPKDYNYHRVPSPWLQVKLLSILGLFGASDRLASQQMYDTLYGLMRSIDSENSASYSIIYECVKTISRIYPNPRLLEVAASSISRFIISNNNNLKYAGITALTNIIQVDPSCVVEHQLAVVDCLQDPDETLKSKTLELLYRMINRENVEVIVDKLIQFLSQSTEPQLSANLAMKITESAERFSPSSIWYVETMNKILEIAGNHIKIESAYNLIKVISRTTNDLTKDGVQLKEYILSYYMDLINSSTTLADSFIRIISWVLGEYGTLYCPSHYTPHNVQDFLITLANRTLDNDMTRAWIITALTKLVFNNRSIDKNKTVELLRKYKQSRNTELQQRSFDGLMLLEDSTRNIINVYPSDINFTSTYDFSFLENYTQQAIRNGAAVYNNELFKSEIHTEITKEAPAQEDTVTTLPLKYAPYDDPSQTKPRKSSHDHPIDSSSTHFVHEKAERMTLPTVPKRWGPKNTSLPQDSTSVNSHLDINKSYEKPVIENQKTPGSSPGSMISFSSPSTSGIWGPKSVNSGNKSTLKQLDYHDNQPSNKQTDKEIMAAALFKGITSSPNSQNNTPQSGHTLVNHNNSLNSSTSKSNGSYQSHSTPMKSPHPTQNSYTPKDEDIDLLTDYTLEPTVEKHDNSQNLYINSVHEETRPINNSASLDDFFDDFSEKRYEYDKKKISENFLLHDLFAPESNTVEDTNDKIDQLNLTSLPIELFPKHRLDQHTNQSFHLVPYDISTSQFANEWPALPLESKETFTYSTRPSNQSDSLFSYIKEILGINYIQIIGQEAIAAAEFQSEGTVLFIHMRCNPQTINIILKSYSQSLINETLSHLKKIIEMFLKHNLEH